MRSQFTALLRQESPLRAIGTGNRFRLATYIIAGLGVIGVSRTLGEDPLLALFLAAILCGWSELNGLCGTSHVMAITSLRLLDQTHNLWWRAVVAYTLGGIATAACVGATIGFLGRAIGIPAAGAFISLAVLSLTLAARELQYIRFELPQIRRQTNRMWAFEFGFVPAAAMWGAHIGLGFATVIAHGGFFVLVGFAVALGPGMGALVLATYWLGRSLPIWIAPLLSPTEANGGPLGDLVLRYEAPYRHVAAIGLVIACSVALALVLERHWAVGP
jgi:hypothetical protein